MRNHILTILKLTVAAVLISVLFGSGHLDFSKVFKSYNNPISLLIGAFCCTGAMITPIFRWWILARIQKLPVGAFAAIRLTMIGYFFNIFIPGGTGGDVVRAGYAIHDFPERKAQALTIAFVDRGLGLHALLLFGVSVFFIHPALFQSHHSLKVWLWIISVLLIIGTVGPMLLLFEQTNRFLLRLLGKVIGGEDAWIEAMKLYRSHPRLLFIAYFFSLGSALFNILFIHFMMLAIDSSPALIESLIIAPLVILANTLPFTPGGIGIAEGTSAGLYTLVGHDGGANGMLLARLFIVFHALLGLPFFLLNRQKAKTSSTIPI